MYLTSVSVAPLVLLAVIQRGHICLSSCRRHTGGMSQQIVTWWHAVIQWVWDQNKEKDKVFLKKPSQLKFTCTLLFVSEYIRVVSAVRSVWEGELDTLLLWLDDIWASSNEGEGEGLSRMRSWQIKIMITLLIKRKNGVIKLLNIKEKTNLSETRQEV